MYMCECVSVGVCVSVCVCVCVCVCIIGRSSKVFVEQRDGNLVKYVRGKTVVT